MNKEDYYKHQEKFWSEKARFNKEDQNNLRNGLIYSNFDSLYSVINEYIEKNEKPVRILFLGYTSSVLRIFLKNEWITKIYIIDKVNYDELEIDSKLKIIQANWQDMSKDLTNLSSIDWVLGDVAFSNLWYEDWDSVLFEIHKTLSPNGRIYFRELFKNDKFKNDISTIINDIKEDNDIEKTYFKLRFGANEVTGLIDDDNILKGDDVFQKFEDYSFTPELATYIKDRRNNVYHTLKPKSDIELLLKQYFKEDKTFEATNDYFYSVVYKKHESKITKNLERAVINSDKIIQSLPIAFKAIQSKIIEDLDNEEKLFNTITALYHEKISEVINILGLSDESIVRLGISLYNSYTSSRFMVNINNNGSGLYNFKKDKDYTSFLREYGTKEFTLSRLTFDYNLKKVKNLPIQFIVLSAGDSKKCYFNINNLDDYILLNEKDGNLNYSSKTFKVEIVNEGLKVGLINYMDGLQCFANNGDSNYKGYILANTIHPSGGYYFHINNKELTIYDLKLIVAILNNFHDSFFGILSDILTQERVANEKLLASLSRIITRNSAHHIESHMSHRATIDKIIERLGWKIKEEKAKINFESFIEQENRFNRYRSERNDFIAGIDSNTHPITVRFYQDIIVPFVENSLIMDNIAKSEGVYWRKNENDENEKKGILTGDEVSKLRIRVFYHKDLQLNPQNGKSRQYGENTGDCLIPFNHKPHNEDSNPIHCTKNNCNKKPNDVELFEKELGLDHYHEICKFYTGVEDQKTKHDETICIHELPYFRKYTDNGWYDGQSLNCDDIEITVPGTLGKHSWWSILENHIRNTAKHANRELLNSSSHLDIIIKVSNVPNLTSPESDKINIENKAYYQVELTSNIPTLKFNTSKYQDTKEEKESDYGKIERFITEDISSDKASLGIADMRINATLLKFEKITKGSLGKAIEVTTFERKTRSNLPVNTMPYVQSLVYQFKMTKPCNVVFIDPSNDFKVEDYHDVKKGIYAYNSYEDCIKELSGKRRAFQFALINANIFNGANNELYDSIEQEYSATNSKAHKIDELLQVLPWRVMVYGKLENDKNLDSLGKRVATISESKFIKSNTDNNHLSDNELLEYCWKMWTQSERWGKDKKFSLNFYFEQERNDPTTKRYLEATKDIDKNLISVYVKYNEGSTNDGCDFERQSEFDPNTITKISEKGNRELDDFSYIIYDRHGASCFGDMNRRLQMYNWYKHVASNRDKISWIFFDKSNIDFDFLNNITFNNPKEEFSKLTEAGLHRILVIDERIREFVLINKLKKAAPEFISNKLIEVTEIGGVKIATGLQINNEEILYKSNDRIQNPDVISFYLQENVWDDNLGEINYNTLIIHRTMIDKILKNEGLFDYLSKKFSNILICTGGGTLSFNSDIMARIRKISYFALAKCFSTGGVAKNNIINLI